MGVFNDVQNALNARLNALSGLPTIAWPNDQKEPAQGTNYIRPTLLAVLDTLYTLNNEDFYRGIYQIDIFTKLKNGSAEALLLADVIREGFRRQSLTSNSTIVHTQEISTSQAERVEGFWRVMVDVNYICVA